MTEDAKEALRRVEGLFVGQLDHAEMEYFREACIKGLAVLSYEGGAGFLGLPKVRLVTGYLLDTPP